MRKSREMEAVAIQFRARIAANRQLTDLLSKNIRDSRVKRIIGLFEEIIPHCDAISFPAITILKICEQDAARYRGFNHQLELLQEELDRAEDFLLEISKRIFLYLEQLKSAGSKLVPSIRQLAESTITELRAMGLELSKTARAALHNTLLKAPGPSPMPYGDDEDSTAKQLKQNRGLQEGQLPSTRPDYDARWDPDVKFPGTMFGKFLRFPGPYFAPGPLGRFLEFALPTVIGDHIDIWQLKYDTLQRNFKRTQRLRIRKPKNCTENFKTYQKNIGIALANLSGENYDLDSVAFYDARRPQELMLIAPQYLDAAWQVRKCRLGTGIWAFEDLNRILEIHQRGSNFMLKPLETGRVVVIDSRNL